MTTVTDIDTSHQNVNFNIKTNNTETNRLQKPTNVDISHIHEFLGAPTPKAWIEKAIKDLPTLIQDHANCEKKAAGTAMNLMFRYEFHRDLQLKLAQLIREEMLHYEQVVEIMKERGQEWQHLPAGRYAKGMLKHKRTFEPAAMIDVLIIGAFIEARSCERFAMLSEAVKDERLSKYYRYLLKSESRHYEDYLMLAKSLEPKVLESKQSKFMEPKAATDKQDNQSIDYQSLKHSTQGSINQSKETLNVAERIAFFREVEAELITSTDSEFRFHSGIPA